MTDKQIIAHIEALTPKEAADHLIQQLKNNGAETVRSAFESLKFNEVPVNQFCVDTIKCVVTSDEYSSHINTVDNIEQRAFFTGLLSWICHRDDENQAAVSLYSAVVQSPSLIPNFAKAAIDSAFTRQSWSYYRFIEIQPVEIQKEIAKVLSTGDHNRSEWAESFAQADCVEGLKILLESFNRTENRLYGITDRALKANRALEYLLINHIDINSTAFRNLSLRIVSERNLEGLKLMKKHGLDLRHQADSLLVYACSIYLEGRDDNTIEYLLDHGLDPQSQFGRPLQICLEKGNIQLYKRLSTVNGELEQDIIQTTVGEMIKKSFNEEESCTMLGEWIASLGDTLYLLDVALNHRKYVVAEFLLNSGVDPKAKRHYLLRKTSTVRDEVHWVASPVGQRILLEYYDIDERCQIIGNLLSSFDRQDWIEPLGEVGSPSNLPALRRGLLMSLNEDDLIEYLPKKNNTNVLLNFAKLYNCPEKCIDLARSNQAKTALAQMMF